MPDSINRESAADQSNAVKRIREEPYRFLDSKDIREHLKLIGYRFSDREIAYMIWHCGSVSLEERHQAWKSLIGASDDHELSAFLNRIIDLEERMLSWYNRSECARCSCIGYLTSGETITAEHKSGDAGDCLRHSMAENHVIRLEVARQVSDSVTVFALIQPDGRVSGIDAEGIGTEDTRLMRAFNSFSLGFPCPFKEGEYLKRINGEGVFAAQPLRFIKPRYDPAHGALAECEYIERNGEKGVYCFPLVDLEIDQ